MWLILWGTVGAMACDTGLLEATRTNLATGKNADVRLRKLAGSLAESCNFPRGLRDALGTVPAVEISNRPSLERKVVLGDAAAWAGACTGGQAAFDKAFAAAGEARGTALYQDCGVERFGFASAGEYAAATGFPFLAVLVAEHFRSQSVDPALATPLLRGLAGLPEGGAPTAAAAVATDPWAKAGKVLDTVSPTAQAALTPAEWGVHASMLLPLCETLRGRPAGERTANRKLEFDTCAQAGRAADHAGRLEAPFFRPLAGMTVNWGYYLAGASSTQDPALLSATTDASVKTTVSWYVEQLTKGALPKP